MERGAASVPFVNPVVGRPRKKVRDKERDPLVHPEGVESWIALDAVELNDIVGLYKRQNADLRVPIGGACDQRPMSHFSYKPLSCCFVRRIVGTGKHLASLAAQRDAN